jgi:hypothetical protein
MKIDADSNGSVGKIEVLILNIDRMAWIHELYASWKLNTIIYEGRSKNC